MKSKYVKSMCILGVKPKQGDSQFWSVLLNHKEHFFSICKLRFLEDNWIGGRPLKTNYPRLYNTCFDMNHSVAEVFNKGLDDIQFRRTLWGIL